MRKLENTSNRRLQYHSLLYVLTIKIQNFKKRNFVFTKNHETSLDLGSIQDPDLIFENGTIKSRSREPLV